MNGSECFEFERILHAKFEVFAQTNSEWIFPLYGTNDVPPAAIPISWREVQGFAG